LEALEVDLDAGRELDAHDVDQAVRGRLPARRDARDLLALANDAFGEQKAHRELSVVARRAHRDRDAFLGAAAVGPRVAEPDLERFLGRDNVNGIRPADAADRESA